MWIFKSIRERFSRVFWTGLAAVALLGCGLTFILVISPQQKIQALQIERLPTMDGDDVAHSTGGDEILVTGHLVGEASPDAEGFVAYTLEEWVVSPADTSTPDAEPDGEWQEIRQIIPPLSLTIGNDSIPLLGAKGAKLSGPMHEKLIIGDSQEYAEYNDEPLPDGSLRYSGFHNGDLVTVWGKKASSEGVIPDEYYAGDRVAFVESQHAEAKGALIGGICMLALAPIVLVGGILSAVFGKR